jgi:hypothetical protein
MPSTHIIIPALEGITGALKDIRRELPSLDPGHITTMLDLYD